MQATFRHDGCYVDYTPSADVAAGEIVLINGLYGVAGSPIAADTLGALRVDGVFEIAKEADNAFLLGDHAFWDAGNEVVTDDDSSGTHKPLGHFAKPALAADTTCWVRLQPGLIADDDSGSDGS